MLSIKRLISPRPASSSFLVWDPSSRHVRSIASIRFLRPRSRAIANEPADTHGATIRARVTKIEFLVGNEAINATLSYNQFADPGWVVWLHVEERNAGELACDDLAVLVGHSPSADLGVRAVGELVVLGVRRSEHPSTLSFIRNDPRGAARAPDLSGVRYLVTRHRGHTAKWGARNFL
jgi:hypothetical protein